MRWESLETTVEAAISAHIAFFDSDSWTVETTRYQDGDFRVSVFTHVRTFNWFGKRVDWQQRTYLDGDGDGPVHTVVASSDAGDRREWSVGETDL